VRLDNDRHASYQSLPLQSSLSICGELCLFIGIEGCRDYFFGRVFISLKPQTLLPPSRVVLGPAPVGDEGEYDELWRHNRTTANAEEYCVLVCRFWATAYENGWPGLFSKSERQTSPGIAGKMQALQCSDRPIVVLYVVVSYRRRWLRGEGRARAPRNRRIFGQ
jgi:hypothetical protein